MTLPTLPTFTRTIPRKEEHTHRVVLAPHSDSTATNEETGKRKQSLHGYSIFLDLETYQHKKQLEAQLRSEGAHVESFLSKNVKYVISDRKEAAALREHSRAPREEPATPHSPPASLTSVRSELTAVSMATTATLEDICRSHHIVTKSHGSSHAQKMIGKANDALLPSGADESNVLMKALRLGIRIKPLKSALEYLHTKCGYPRLDAEVAAATTTTQINSASTKPAQPKIKLLREPFLKIEDLTDRFRPTFKEWKHVDGKVDIPEFSVNIDDYMSPFSPATFYRKPKAAPARDHARVKSKPKKLKPKSATGYCECCSLNYFKGIDEHRRSTKHREYASKDSNFTEIDECFNLGLSLADMLERELISLGETMDVLGGDLDDEVQAFREQHETLLMDVQPEDMETHEDVVPESDPDVPRPVYDALYPSVQALSCNFSPIVASIDAALVQPSWRRVSPSNAMDTRAANDESPLLFRAHSPAVDCATVVHADIQQHTQPAADLPASPTLATAALQLTDEHVEPAILVHHMQARPRSATAIDDLQPAESTSVAVHDSPTTTADSPSGVEETPGVTDVMAAFTDESAVANDEDNVAIVEEPSAITMPCTPAVTSDQVHEAQAQGSSQDYESLQRETTVAQDVPNAVPLAAIELMDETALQSCVAPTDDIVVLSSRAEASVDTAPSSPRASASEDVASTTFAHDSVVGEVVVEEQQSTASEGLSTSTHGNVSMQEPTSHFAADQPMSSDMQQVSELPVAELEIPVTPNLTKLANLINAASKSLWGSDPVPRKRVGTSESDSDAAESVELLKSPSKNLRSRGRAPHVSVTNSRLDQLHPSCFSPTMRRAGARDTTRVPSPIRIQVNDQARSGSRSPCLGGNVQKTPLGVRSALRASSLFGNKTALRTPTDPTAPANVIVYSSKPRQAKAQQASTQGGTAHKPTSPNLRRHKTSNVARELDLPGSSDDFKPKRSART